MEWLNEISTIATIAATLTGGCVVAVGNMFLNSRGITLNVQKAANEAASAVVKDMRDLIAELKDELERKDRIIQNMGKKITTLEAQVRQMRLDIKEDTAEIIREVKKK